jgi:hypothetical protein
MNVREVEFWKITGQKTDKVYYVKITPLQSETKRGVQPPESRIAGFMESGSKR